MIYLWVPDKYKPCGERLFLEECTLINSDKETTQNKNENLDSDSGDNKLFSSLIGQQEYLPRSSHNIILIFLEARVRTNYTDAIILTNFYFGPFFFFCFRSHELRSFAINTFVTEAIWREQPSKVRPPECNRNG